MHVIIKISKINIFLNPYSVSLSAQCGEQTPNPRKSCFSKTPQPPSQEIDRIQIPCINQLSPANTSSDSAIHEAIPAHQLLPPNGLKKLISIELPLIEIQIDNATPEFQQSLKRSRYHGKYYITNRCPFLKRRRKLQQNHRPSPPGTSVRKTSQIIST